MSHELRTPPNAALGYTQIRTCDPPLDARQIARIDTIQQSGEHLLKATIKHPASPWSGASESFTFRNLLGINSGYPIVKYVKWRPLI
jgi:hypothetical protein